MINKFLIRGDKSVSKIKICGLKSIKDIEIVNKFIPDYIGFVFAPSKRQINLENAKQLKSLLNPSIKTVGVFVNEHIEKILQYEQQGIIDIVQLHGDEDLVYIKALKKASDLPIVKAFRLKDTESLQRQHHLIENAELDGVLLDAYYSSSYGGSGKQFDWHILNQIQRQYFLAGGIGLDNVKEALTYKPFAIDVSSKVETNGNKDEEKIRTLISIVRKML